jgi:hypothetical protein
LVKVEDKKTMRLRLKTHQPSAGKAKAAAARADITDVKEAAATK